jgi:glycopeptide antibiotics resistance protein|tara:strand:- start:27 stop:254 length:228 start_codon:yes stop_codon:yes gene_type:complete
MDSIILSNDKIQHFIVGFLLSMLGVVFLPLIVLGFVFGVGKEVYDYISGKGVAEVGDILATFCGAIIAVIIVVIL